MRTVEYTQLDDAQYTTLRRKLLRVKGSVKQVEFLYAVKSEDAFLKYMKKRVRRIGSEDVALAPYPMTEDEFKAPPADTEATLYKLWQEIPSRVTSTNTFWAQVTCRHIEAGKIKSVYLAANGGNLGGGDERIDRALSEQGKNTDESAKQIDNCVRTVFRRMSGLPEARGRRTVYVNCPLARAWWRERIVEQVAGTDSKLARRVRSILRISQNYWEKIVDRIVSRNSTFGPQEVRTSFLLTLCDVADDHDANLRKTKALQTACRRLAAIQATRELSVLDKTNLTKAMDVALALSE